MEVATLNFVDYDEMRNKMIDTITSDDDLIKYKKDAVQNDLTVLNTVNVSEIIKDISGSGYQEEPFFVCDLGDIVAKFEAWREKMPRVVPYYAVKCNDSDAVIKVLGKLGAGFDCASKGEITKVLGLGISSDRIIFANPMKKQSHIQHALASNIPVMTFDSDFELRKIKHLYPDAQLVLRIRCEAKEALCPLGQKFGCDPVTEAPQIIQQCKTEGMNLTGISFHVGSGCMEPEVFRRAIHAARVLFDLGASLGHKMNLLDIGGGFPGNKKTASLLDEISAVVNSAIDDFFPDPNVKIISEPGRFFVASAYTLASHIYAKKDIKVPGTNDIAKTMYYITDGVYGSFNCIFFDHQHVTPIVVKDITNESRQVSAIWGPTCDALDIIADDIKLPKLDVGDWFMFENMGAYTIPCASTFNGFSLASIKHYISEDMWKVVNTY